MGKQDRAENGNCEEGKEMKKTPITPTQYIRASDLPLQDCDVKEYRKILKIVSKKRLNITEIACRIGKSHTNTGLKIKVLENRGYIKKGLCGEMQVYYFDGYRTEAA